MQLKQRPDLHFRSDKYLPGSDDSLEVSGSVSSMFVQRCGDTFSCRFGLSCGVFWLQVGVIQYGSKVVHEFSLGEYQTVEEVVEAARSIDQRGGEETRTALGINVARYDTQ